MIDHGTAERRSVRYHAVIADRMTREPAILERARERVQTWLRTQSVAEHYARGWSEILARPMHEIRGFLLDDSERALAFRQVSPFAGALDPRERWRLWAQEREAHDPNSA